MRINTNSTALSAAAQLNLNSQVIDKLAQHLSTGLRINSAADDPSGLAIAQNMLAQSRGTDQGIQNIQDTISVLQTAEGGMGSIVNAIQRMRVLAVQAANDTLTDGDRQHIQVEIDQLKQQIQSVARTTQFNGQNLLDGTFNISFQPTPFKLGGFLNDAGLDFNSGFNTMTLALTPSGGTANQTSFTTNVVPHGFFRDTNLSVLTRIAGFINGNANGVNATLLADSSGSSHAIQTTGPTGSAYNFVDVGNPPGDLVQVAGLNNSGELESGKYFTVQAGANSQDTLPLNIPDMGLQALGLDSVNVVTTANAESAISTLDQAVQAVGGNLATIGSGESRLSKAQITGADTSTNLTTAYSGIVDSNTARDASLYSVAQLTLNTGEAVLTRAIQSTYGLAMLTVDGLKQRFPIA